MTTNPPTTTLPEHGTGQLGRELPPRQDKPQGKPKKRGFIWFFFLLIVVGVTSYAVWRASQPNLIPQTNQFGRGGFGGGRGGRGGFNGPIPVVVATASSKPVPIYLDGLGNVAAFYTVTVKSRVDGQLMKVNFQEGDLVKEGQVLAEIDPRPFQVQLAQAEGVLAHDLALLDNSKVDLNRYETLVKQQAVPTQQLDTQRALVAQYEGTVAQDRANVDNAKLQLVYAHVTAPITGVVGLRLVDPGNIVHASDANGMIVITQLQPISVLFTIPEDDLPSVIPKLRAGQHLPVDAYNRDNSKKIASGTLLTVDNQIDSSTGTSKLKAIFDNNDFSLFPQQFVNIRLLVDTLQNQIVVPAVAVQNGQQGSFVYIIDDHNTAHMRSVQVLSTGQNGADIKSGLSVGDQVAVDGADRLQDGAMVRVRQAGEVEKEAATDAAAMAARRGRGGRGGRGPNGGGGGQGQPGTGSGQGVQNFAPGAGPGGPQGQGGGGQGFGSRRGGPDGRGDAQGFGGHRGGGQGHGRDGKGYQQQ